MSVIIDALLVYGGYKVYQKVNTSNFLVPSELATRIVDSIRHDPEEWRTDECYMINRTRDIYIWIATGDSNLRLHGSNGNDFKLPFLDRLVISRAYCKFVRTIDDKRKEKIKRDLLTKLKSVEV